MQWQEDPETGGENQERKKRNARRKDLIAPAAASVAVVVLSGSTPLPSGTRQRVVAEELQLDLAKLNLASVVSRQVGETEKTSTGCSMRRERSGSILFFDGADACLSTGRAGKAGPVTRPLPGRPISATTHRGSLNAARSFSTNREKWDRSSLVPASEGVRDGGHQKKPKKKTA
ncbi:MAG: hypothetical protein IPL14_16155 [Nitrospira sp.]|nr:hypothetical protein [Nitrospira sp.]